MAETQKQRIDRIANELAELSDLMEAHDLLNSGIAKIEMILINPLDPTNQPIGHLTVGAADLLPIVKSAVLAKVEAMNADHVKL